MIKVLVRGLGRVGSEVAKAVSAHPELELVGGVDIKAQASDYPVFDYPVFTDTEIALDALNPDVMVDFTQHDAVMPAVRLAAERGVNLVIGTTGLSSDELAEINRLAQQNGIEAVVASNFSLGAVLMMCLARILAKFFDWAEITELHHENKQDSPSGTAITTARKMIEARGGKDFLHVESKKETLPGARGALLGGVSIHSVRLQGLMAHQEVTFGTLGQTLKIRHDQISREGFCPGVIIAIKRVMELQQEGSEGGLIPGIDELMGL